MVKMTETCCILYQINKNGCA